MIPNKPKNVIWTDEQWKAIYDNGHNILVSAGAGSGKTAVLTERLKEKIVNGASLKRLIVLTFTKDASLVMKERLRTALTNAYQKEPNELVKEHLFNELNEIDEAHIQTFDSYTAFIVKKYHYLLGLPETVNMIDEGYLNQKIYEIIKSVIDEEFNIESPDIILLCDLFTTKNSEKIVDIISTVIRKLELVIDQKSYLNNYLSNYYCDEFYNKLVERYFQEIDQIIDTIASIWSKDYGLTEEITKKYFGDCVDVLRLLLNVSENKDLDQAFKYHKIRDFLPIKFPRAPRKEKAPSIELVLKLRDQTKKYLDKLEEMMKYASIDEMIKEYQSTKDIVQAILNITKKAILKVERLKSSINEYTFMDIAKFAIKLLEDNNNIRLDIKNSTNEILIDEYQDTSDVQEKLISLISNDNVYMVGDIKQSIYRFRNANPQIFKDKYEKYKMHQGGEVIDLMKNFRSRSEVIDDVNDIFNDLMTSEYGGVNYPHNHKLIFGNDAYSTSSNASYHMVNLTYNLETVDNYSKIEAEAFIVGKDILRRMENERILKNGVLVKPTYRDFAVLSNSSVAHETFAKIFKYLGIPFVISSKSSFIRSEEIYFIKAMLECSYSLISNEYYSNHYDIALLTILRSFIFEKSDDEIHELFTHNITLKQLDSNLYNKLYKYAGMMKNNSLSKIIIAIYRDFDIYLNLVKLGNINQREQKIMFFYQKAKEFQQFKIIDFLNYLEEVSNNEKIDIEYNQRNETEDSVSITTIHKSKGLEYPICYVVDLDRDFNLMDINSNFLFSLDYGIITPIFDNGLKSVVTKRLFKNEYLKAEIGEKIRLYYVALTRAKEKLIFVSPLVKETNDSLDDFIKANFRSFYDFNNALYQVLAKYTIEIDLLNIGLTKDYLKNVSKTKEQIKGKLVSNHRKYSPIKTDIVELENYNFSKNIESIISKNDLEKMEIGTAFHKALEFASIIEKANPYQNLFVEKFLNQSLIQDHKFINEYHEYSFIDNNNHLGFIDLILETDDSIYIIDYKLKNITDPGYLKQLESYKQYIEKITNKKIYKYLYSIIDQKFILLPE